MNKSVIYLACGVLFLGIPMAQAQEAQNAEDVLKASGVEKQASQEQPKEELTEEQLARKVELANKMHEINPVKDQIDAAVNIVAKQLPEQQRAIFMNAMYSTMNYRAVERISIDAMVETYTLPELEAMVDYYSKPEAQSAGEKMSQWAARVQPEIMRMIDKAMIKTRTGQ
tara:strand:- start:306 stop:815 length:510 start_codon:yes stop_codon:yes gene_type:complete